MAEFIEVTRYRDMGNATISRSKLESEGIHVLMNDAELNHISGILPLDEGFIKLLVARPYLSDARKILGLEDVPYETSTAGARTGSMKTSYSYQTPFILSIFAVGILAFFTAYYYIRAQRQDGENAHFRHLRDATGDCVTGINKKSGKPVYKECDRNDNDIYEYSSSYGQNGILLHEYFDENENFVYEKDIAYRTDGTIVYTNYDADENDFIEKSTFHDEKGDTITIYFDKDSDQFFEKEEALLDSGIKRITIDTDGDHIMDRIRYIDKNGNIIRELKI